MSERRDVLFELGTEELPPKSLLTLSQSLSSQVEAGLNKAAIGFNAIHPYATPRRLALLIEGVEVSQPDLPIERRGPAKAAAFNPDGSPSKALEGFLKGAQATVKDLVTLETDKGAWVAVRQIQKGVMSRDLIADIVRQALAGLPIAKRMRWGNGSAEFVRPVHWVVLMMGSEVIETEILGIQSGRVTRGHRFHGTSQLTLDAPREYAGVLEHQGWVLVDFARRKQKIQELAEAAALTVKGQAVIDPDLLNEVTALVEWPVPVLGGFESRFLNLPPEVLITTMQANQKYFPVRAQGGELLPHFITFSNLDSSRLDTVREGNERVVRPRLTDAEFFWNQDLKRSLGDRFEDLGQVTFQKVLGSIKDKSLRVESLAVHIAGLIGVNPAATARAARLAKADLLTAMVGEFPELQGIMGRYYALAEGESLEVATAIEEQYLPKVSGGELPGTDAGRILAVAEKLDTLCGIFSAGLIPTGDRDPFALRRAALGIIRISLESALDLDLPALVGVTLSQFQHAFDVAETRGKVEAFILDRLRGYVLEKGYRPDEYEAVLAVSPASLLDFMKRLEAVRAFRSYPEAESLAAANKRLRNILRKLDAPVTAEVAPEVLQDTAEQELLEEALAAREDLGDALKLRDYTRAMKRLSGLRVPIDRFFDEVMVMAEEEGLRRNRLGLLALIEALFLNVADISRLQG